MFAKGNTARGSPVSLRAMLVQQEEQHAHWDTLLHLVAPHLADQETRANVRLVCKDWRAAADANWRCGCFSGGTVGNGQLVWCSGTFLLPRLQQLCLVELTGPDQLQLLLARLSTAAVPALRHLALSAPLGQQVADGGGIAALQLPQLRRLELDDIIVAGGLASLTHLQQLTQLVVHLTVSAESQAVSVAGVARLQHLPHLQDLSLPQLQEEERDALSALTGLTRLSFMAAGKGAVGPSLLPLTRLQHLEISLCHVHEHFIVLHPAVDWGALRALATLRSLRICHLAAYTFFSAPEVTWTDEAPAALQAELLLAQLPAIQHVQLRLSFCRLAEEHVTAGEPEAVHIPSPTEDSTSTRLFHRTIEYVPVRQAGCRHADGWYSAWWQAAVQRGRSSAAAQRFTTAATELAGWTQIRPGACRTFDVLVEYCLPAHSSRH